MPEPYILEFDIPDSAIDVNGHVNNVQYVQWMQDIAIAHSNAAGCTAASQAAGCAWFARSHRIEYARQAFAGERIQVKTWVADARRSSSTRHYEFVRLSDGAKLAKGETCWIYVDAASGRPKSIPPVFAELFGLNAKAAAAAE